MKLPERALTLHQPWAALVVAGGKDIENRSWRPPEWIIGQTIAIHAGKHYDDGVWILVPPSAIAHRLPHAIEHARGAIVGTARVVGYHDPSEWPAGEWHMRGQYGWILTERRALDVPIVRRGAQRLWRVR